LLELRVVGLQLMAALLTFNGGLFRVRPSRQAANPISVTHLRVCFMCSRI
jgi:hypothetical protein